MYTIFKNDTRIILTDDVKKLELNHLVHWKDLRHEDLLDEKTLSVKKEILIFHHDLKTLWLEFSQHFEVIEAAGGIVRNSGNELLFIYRFDKWDLPKGKIEDGESREMAAIREVKEECGFGQIELGRALSTTYHIYMENNKEVLKITYWFNMYSDDCDLKPQLEEGITTIRWVKETDTELVLHNTYPNIQLLLKAYQAVNQ
jgi:8-oxo-dGTP pyrophosphatase MutT (NUDIX family)